MEKNHVRIKTFGDLSRLSPELRQLCLDAQERSASFVDVQVNFCLNYGGRDEIVRAARAFAADVAAGKCDADDLTETGFAQYLDSAGVPDPELVIRPSGEKRTSNFLPWQTVYSEFVFMNVLWPDFGPAELDAAIEEYHRRNRRFGGA
jgi:undecaprenyl diphosphate synthase